MKKTRIIIKKYYLYTVYEPQKKFLFWWMPINPENGYTNLDSAIKACKQYATPTQNQIIPVTP